MASIFFVYAESKRTSDSLTAGSGIAPRLNCDCLTRHDNAGGRSHGQLHGGL